MVVRRKDVEDAVAMPEFQDRLEYLDERYEHLRKHIKALKAKMHMVEESVDLQALLNEKHAILKHDNDEENERIIQEIIDEIKREKQMLRDEAAIIRGELNQATYKEEGRKSMSGERRRAEMEALERERWLAEREERLAREAAERERRRQEALKENEAIEEEQKRRAEINHQRALAMDRLKNLHLYLEEAQPTTSASATLPQPLLEGTPTTIALSPILEEAANGGSHIHTKAPQSSGGGGSFGFFWWLFCRSRRHRSETDTDSTMKHVNGGGTNGTLSRASVHSPNGTMT